jgi:putative tricarboxylic transport membrane protein
MKHRELESSLFWIGVGVIFCAGALKYGLLRHGMPGAGLFPFMAGIVLIGLALVLLVSALRSRREEASRATTEHRFFPEEDSWKRLSLALIVLVAYGVALEHLGFLIVTFVFMVLLLRFVEPERWITALGIAFIATASSYIIFRVWLGVPLPVGILKFLGV